MRFLVLLLFCCISMATVNAQDNSSSDPAYAPSIGLQVGSTAPAFTLVDQFDRPQSNETLRGPNGTVILFFRSSDW
jgi:cytochrome oxidase Cu insertion factor (SCO1/SenC/PrrC family)